MSGSSTRMPPRGAGIPRKNFFRSSLLLSSFNIALKRASLVAMQIAPKSTAPQPRNFIVLKCHKYIISPGATPKFTRSHKESSSAPKLVSLCSARATRPSIPSKKAAINIRVMAASSLPFNAICIAVKPEHNDSMVTELGIRRLIGRESSFI